MAGLVDNRCRSASGANAAATGLLPPFGPLAARGAPLNLREGAAGLVGHAILGQPRTSRSAKQQLNEIWPSFRLIQINGSRPLLATLITVATQSATSRCNSGLPLKLAAAPPAKSSPSRGVRPSFFGLLPHSVELGQGHWFSRQLKGNHAVDSPKTATAM